MGPIRLEANRSNKFVVRFGVAMGSQQNHAEREVHFGGSGVQARGGGDFSDGVSKPFWRLSQRDSQIEMRRWTIRIQTRGGGKMSGYECAGGK